MNINPFTSLDRVFGNEAVLSRLERLGRQTRILPNLLTVGFPPHQLSEARIWYAQAAETPVEHYASHNMARGFFEDESLLQVFCRYFECTDWKLENSPWFFAQDDYNQFYDALIKPVEFSIARLEQGLDEELWGHHFMGLPFELGLENAQKALWDALCRQEHYWKPHRTYAHLRAEAMFGYLMRSMELTGLRGDRFNYRWEEIFRQRFQEVLTRFEVALEGALRFWREFHENSERQAGAPGAGNPPPTPQALAESLTLLGLKPGTMTLEDVARAFRKQSKSAHPDQGGSDEAFRRLAEAKERLDSWLNSR